MEKAGGKKIKIEKNVPVPPKRGRFADLPFERLQVGESFFVPYPPDETNPQRLFNFQAGITGQGNYTANRLKRRFTVRKVKDGVRVWRLY